MSVRKHECTRTQAFLVAQGYVAVVAKAERWGGFNNTTVGI